MSNELSMVNNRLPSEGEDSVQSHNIQLNGSNFSERSFDNLANGQVQMQPRLSQNLPEQRL